ncbi:D-alanine--D-alanine ligase [Thiotrichales bacterium 19S9-12]|nr:D-alanine--D-alanine ligase [Thiotrichales bacterium 19S9-11]MCF6811859.1 D-alanine--D-alanine ligase [Thiotrichales bacterium 19S9-12]
MNQAIKLNIAVLFGGISIERDVSFASAKNVIKLLRSKGHEVSAFSTENGLLDKKSELELLDYHVGLSPPDKFIKSDKKENKTQIFNHIDSLKSYDLVFIALHGKFGEDGHIQAILELANIPYTGSNLTSSALAMNKHFSKRIVQSAGVITPDWRLVTQLNYNDIEIHQFPIVVKPNTQGSSVGVSIVYDEDQLNTVLKDAFYYDYEILIEEYIKGKELTIGILNDKALSPGEIKNDEDTFSYYHKYQPGATIEKFPASIDEATTTYVKTAALTAHHALCLYDYSRIDLILDKNDQLWFLEANSLPGLTETSLYPQSANASGISVADALEEICFQALGRYRKMQQN